MSIGSSNVAFFSIYDRKEWIVKLQQDGSYKLAHCKE